MVTGFPSGARPAIAGAGTGLTSGGVLTGSGIDADFSSGTSLAVDVGGASVACSVRAASPTEIGEIDAGAAAAAAAVSTGCESGVPDGGAAAGEASAVGNLAIAAVSGPDWLVCSPFRNENRKSTLEASIARKLNAITSR
jgi:hypothetical protein